MAYRPDKARRQRIKKVNLPPFRAKGVIFAAVLYNPLHMRKCYLPLLFIVSGFSATAQDLSGCWLGTLESLTEPNVILTRHTIKLEIAQSGNLIAGKSLSIGLRMFNWKEDELSGFISGDEVFFTQNNITRLSASLRSPVCWTNFCMGNMRGRLYIDSARKRMIIRGSIRYSRVMHSVTRVVYNTSAYVRMCQPDTFTLYKPWNAEPALPAQATFISGQVFDRQTRRPVEAIVSLVDSLGNAQTLHTDKDGVYFFNVPLNSQYRLVAVCDRYAPTRTHVQTDNFITVKDLYLDPDKPGAPIPVIPATPFTARNIQVQHTVETIADTLELAFYDDGIVDNDTVTVYLNRQIILNRQLLTDKPLKIKIPLPAGQENELIMFADNLGSIPPNTALLVFYENGIRREIQINADYGKSAAIIFRKLEKEVQ